MQVVRDASELGKGEIEDAWHGFCMRLRSRGFSPRFIESYAEDLFGQAQFELLQTLAKGVGIHTPPAWLIHCAWRRTQSLLDKQRRAPSTSPIEAVAPVQSEAPTPEEESLTSDLRRRLREGMRWLPPDERRIVELVYIEGMSSREASRRLGWGNAKGDRRREAALQRLRPFLEG